MTEPFDRKVMAKLELPDWQHVGRTLDARFATGDFATGLKFVNQIGAAAEQANHHPDITLSYGQVRIVLSSHDVDAVTNRDVDLAREVSKLAQAMGLRAEPEQPQPL